MNNWYFLEQLIFYYLKKISKFSLMLTVYSYFNPLTGSNFEALIAGKIETIVVIKIEHIEIIKIDFKLISEGIVLKK